MQRFFLLIILGFFLVVGVGWLSHRAVAADEPADFATLTAPLEKQEGLFTFYGDAHSGKAYLAVSPGQLNQNFLLMATLESGVGEAGLFRGRPVNEFLIQFRPAPNDQLQVVVPNTYLQPPQTGPDGRDRTSNRQFFSDSVVMAAKVVSVDPDTQAQLIDLSDLLLKQDLPDLRGALSYGLGGYSMNDDLSQLDQLQVFPQNVELGATLAFTGDGKGGDSLSLLFGPALRNLADRRGFSLQVRYSLSALPYSNGYRPRRATSPRFFGYRPWRAAPTDLTATSTVGT